MRNFKSSGRFRYSRRTEMYKAVCDNCGKDCMVPFRPTGNKPVFCSDCFEEKGGGSKFSRGDDRGRRRDRYSEKQMFSAVCDNCGARCEVPFSPTGDKPVYCDNCFGAAGEGRESDDLQDIRKQLETLNDKVSQILRLLVPPVAGEQVAEVQHEDMPKAKKPRTTKKKAKTRKTKKK